MLGGIYRHAGDPTAANNSFAEARQIMESRAAEAADDPARQARLAVAQTREAESLADLKQTASALELLDKAVIIWTKLAANPAAPAGVREGLSESLWERARLLRTLGRTADAEKTDLEREGLWRGRTPNDLVALAGEGANRAAVIGYGKTALDARVKLCVSSDWIKPRPIFAWPSRWVTAISASCSRIAALYDCFHETISNP